MKRPATTAKRWTIKPQDDRATDLADRLKTSPLIAQLLLNRGVTDPPTGQAFLRPSLKTLHDPSVIPGLTAAAERVAQAIKNDEAIVIFGDYDVDGITATAILWHAITQLGGRVRTYIPHRVDEGYGLNAAAVEQLADEGAQLLITVDCGITAIAPIAAARARGVDVIVTDHHEWKEAGLGLGAWGLVEDADKYVGPESSSASSPSPKPQASSPQPTATTAPIPLLPDTPFIVHPRLGAGSPNPNLCGAGVAFKLAWGVGQAMAGGGRVAEPIKNFLVESMALAALGTIADVVPLVGENRVLAHFGLGGLKNTKLVGLRALIDSADLTSKKIDSYHVGFLLAPRLNAAGRMGHARLAVEMLTTATELRAAEIADYLEQQNKLRQQTERAILEAALSQVEQLRLDKANAIVVGGVGWHPGVIGIVASRLVDRFHRPSIVIAIDPGDDNETSQNKDERNDKNDAPTDETSARTSATDTRSADPARHAAARAVDSSNVNPIDTQKSDASTSLPNNSPASPPGAHAGLGMGSGRSIDGFHLSKALAAVGHLLVSHGGHEMAAGLKLTPDNFEAFRAAFVAHASEVLGEEQLLPQIKIDADAELNLIDETLVTDFARLGPFGRGNPKPLLRCENLILTGPPRRIGKTGDHLSLMVKKQGGRPMKAIAFGCGDWADKLSEGDRVHLCVQPTINEFNGYRNVELEVKDLKRAE